MNRGDSHVRRFQAAKRFRLPVSVVLAMVIASAAGCPARTVEPDGRSGNQSTMTLWRSGQWTRLHHSLDRQSRSRWLSEDELRCLIAPTRFTPDGPAQPDGKPLELAVQRIRFDQGRWEEILNWQPRDRAGRWLLNRAAARSQRPIDLSISSGDRTREQGRESHEPFNADRWAALAIEAERRGFKDAAVAAWLRAIRVDCRDPSAYRGLRQALLGVGRDDDAERARSMAAVLEDTRRFADETNRMGTDARLRRRLADWLIHAGRPFEALSWRVAALRIEIAGGEPHLDDDLRRLRRDRERLAAADRVDEILLSQRLLGIKMDSFPDQGLFATQPSTGSSSGRRVRAESAAVEVVFRDIAADVGLDHEYFNHVPKRLRRIRLHESLGGGVAVIDFDLDGWPDLHFAQGDTGTSDGSIRSYNSLHRNCGAASIEVAPRAGVDDSGHSLGVTTGDWNQDGWPDLLVGNVGPNRLMTNNGDGTFRSTKLTRGHRFRRELTASVAIADVSGDGLPDLIEANYANDPGIDRPPRAAAGGRPMPVSPLDYVAAADRCWALRRGRWDPFEPDGDDPPPVTSLGLIVGDLDGRAGNEWFVAADMTANRLWQVNVREGDNPDHSPSWTDAAAVAGVAVGDRGQLAACMGIAIADFDHNGWPDLHVTNFFRQPNHLFLGRGGGLFADRGPSWDLTPISFSQLGFGSTALDVDRDGWTDLVIANGHVEDMGDPDQPLAMPMQWLRSRGEGFVDASASVKGRFGGPAVRRALARIDWDRDGQIDLVATSLDRPSELFRSASVGGANGPERWIEFELRGVRTERDAIGSRVTVVGRDGSRRVAFCVTGDGYLARSESVLRFDWPKDFALRTVEVDWANGDRTTFAPQANGPAPGGRYLIVEGVADAWRRELP